jgi:hypothetical protein
VATVRIEGVAFEPDDAAEFAERTRRYVGAMPVALSPGIALAVQIEQRIAEGGGDVTLTEEEKRAALAVVDEWRQSRAAPDAVRELHRLLRVQIAGEASRMQDDDGA